jgi:nitroimidazol reductase NimA-like FMN-containing flavoprotein (pyridoxamine 5'-phosphate oxidase superfamily)
MAVTETTSMLELDRPECLELIAATRFGRLAVNIGDGPPLIRPVNYVFDPPSQSVAFRTADGTKLYALLRSARAAFEIDGIDNDTQTGWSVITMGVTEEVTSPSDLRRLDGLGLESWAPGEKTHWIRIRAWTVSGRRIVHQPIEPGAGDA